MESNVARLDEMRVRSQLDLERLQESVTQERLTLDQLTRQKQGAEEGMKIKLREIEMLHNDHQAVTHQVKSTIRLVVYK